MEDKQVNIFGTKRPTKSKRVEMLLKSSGWGGASNWDLNKITFRYGAVIERLRKDGHEIITQKVNNDGLYKYIWVS